MVAHSLFELSPPPYIPVVRVEGKPSAECTCAHVGSIHSKFLGMGLVLKGTDLCCNRFGLIAGCTGSECVRHPRGLPQ